MDTKEFQKSITEELNVVKNRVRNLIGSRHWGEEGRYKEAILNNILRKFLPSNISIGTGFIVNANNPNNISKQIDIIKAWGRATISNCFCMENEVKT